MEHNDIRTLAALSIVKELYDEKRDKYDIIAEMVKTIIIIQSCQSFSLDEICEALRKESCGLQMPSSVVKNALKKLEKNITFSKANGIYTLTTPFPNDEVNSINTKYRRGQSEIDSIINNLFQYIEKKECHTLLDEEKKQLQESFLFILLDEGNTNRKYSAEVSAFIISQENNADFIANLNALRESLVIYQGLSYNADNKNVLPFERPVKIFIEQEILFHAEGLHGILYKDLFEDFYNLVDEINRFSYKNRKNSLISLCYFPETKQDIEQYYSRAEDIVSHRAHLDESRTAMVEIVNGCKTPSDVQQKRTRFFYNLEHRGIKQDDISFDPTNANMSKYNITCIDDIDSDDPSESAKIYNITQMLSKINYGRRTCGSGNFQKIEVLLLTGKSKTRDISRQNTKDNETQLALTLNYLTNRFWFATNKGVFSGEATPKNLKILNLARISYSKQHNSILYDNYKKLKTMVDHGEMTIAEANQTIVDINTKFITPETVNSDLLNEDNSVFSIFTPDTLERVSAERERERINAKEEITKRDRALSNLIEHQNNAKHKEYKKNIHDYQYNRRKYIKKQLCCKWLKAFSILFLYLTLNAAASLLKLLPTGKTFLVIIYIAINLILTLVLLLIKSAPLKTYTQFVFCNKNRHDFIREIIIKYNTKNKRPVFSPTTIEKILN